MILKENIILYHGSYSEISAIDLSRCEDGKDFGKGFYLTTDYNQAAQFVKTSVEKAIKNGLISSYPDFGYVSFFKYTSNTETKIFEFDDASRNWLHCVVAHRRKGLLIDELKKWEKYDVIAGKIANDTTNQVITAYMNGLYGEIGSESADNMAISLLLPNKLLNQICFRSQASLKSLMFQKSQKVSLEKK